MHAVRRPIMLAFVSHSARIHSFHTFSPNYYSSKLQLTAIGFGTTPVIVALRHEGIQLGNRSSFLLRSALQRIPGCSAAFLKLLSKCVRRIFLSSSFRAEGHR